MELKVARKRSWLAVSDYLIGLNRAAFSLGNHVALIMRAQENRKCGIKSVMMTMGVVCEGIMSEVSPTQTGLFSRTDASQCWL